jgi:hypothetical protein
VDGEDVEPAASTSDGEFIEQVPGQLGLPIDVPPDFSRADFARFFVTFLVVFLVTVAGAFVAGDHGLGWLQILLGIAAFIAGPCALAALAGIAAPHRVARWLNS